MVTKMLLLSPPGCWIMPHIWTWFQQGRWDQGNHWGRACDPCPLGVGAEPPAQRTWGGDTYDPDPLVTAAPIAMGSRSRGTRDPVPSEQSCLWPQLLSPHLQQWSPQTYMYSPVKPKRPWLPPALSLALWFGACEEEEDPRPHQRPTILVLRATVLVTLVAVRPQNPKGKEAITGYSDTSDRQSGGWKVTIPKYDQR